MEEIVILQHPGSRRSAVVAEALETGASRAGMAARRLPVGHYGGGARVVAAYGFVPPLPQVMEEQRAAGGVFVHVDLGYWCRHLATRLDGYHKVTVGGRHPSARQTAPRRDPRRLALAGVRVLPWRETGPRDVVVVAGMSGKAAETYGLAPEEWERRTVARLREITDRPIVYRPKPKWRAARPISGTSFSGWAAPLEALFHRTHVLVTHHSNAAVDALVAGIPVCAEIGPARLLGSPDVSPASLERPRRPDGREAWAAALAWCQWTPAEMAEGLTWRHLREEGLL